MATMDRHSLARRHGPIVLAGPNPALGPSMLTAPIILFGVVAAQLADALTFTVGVSRFGIALESNGIASALFHAAGLGGVLLLKGAVLLVAIALLVVAARRFPRLLVWGGAAATSLGLLGFLTNSASILLLS
jgi:hypothetical protein